MTADHDQDSGRDNRRGEHRQRTLKGGRVIFNGGFSVFDCTVKNMSPHGAMLVFSGPLGIPSKFDLVVESNRRPCTVRWRSEKAIGVSFDDAS